MEQGCNGHRVEHLQLRNGSASLPQLVHRTFGEDVLNLCTQVGLLLELKHFFPSCGNSGPLPCVGVHWALPAWFCSDTRALPWRRRGRASTTENMQICSLVRSGLATSFSLRHLALLWEALIIFCCFTHSQKYDETRTECVFSFRFITVSIINYSAMRLNHISYFKGASFCLQTPDLGQGRALLVVWRWLVCPRPLPGAGMALPAVPTAPAVLGPYPRVRWGMDPGLGPPMRCQLLQHHVS